MDEGQGATLKDGEWAGQSAYLVGGGPSLRDFDWTKLSHLKNIIVVNAAMKHVQHADIFFTEDIRFIEKFYTEDWYRAFKGTRVFHALDPLYEDQALAFDPALKVIRKHGGAWERNDKYWSKSFSDGLSYSSNSMIGALNIADIMGADYLYLLGVDCNPVRRENPNFHLMYPQDWRTFDSQLESFKSDFEHWAAHHLKHRTVINCNPSSAVDCWDKVDVFNTVHA